MNNEDIDWMKVAFMIMHASGKTEFTITEEDYCEMEALLTADDQTVIVISEYEHGTHIQLLLESEADKQEAAHLLTHPEADISTRKH